MSSNSESEFIVCPFCGLLCDDVVVNRGLKSLTVSAGCCEIAADRFKRVVNQKVIKPEVAHRPVSFEHAISEATHLLVSSRAPVVSGMMTDVDGVRAALELTDYIHGVVDHQSNGSHYMNTARIQTYGGYFATLSEVRNRADVIVLVGNSLESKFPRLLERLTQPASKNHYAKQSQSFIRLCSVAADKDKLPAGSLIVECELERLSSVLSYIRRSIEEELPISQIEFNLPDRLLNQVIKLLTHSKYSVFVWSASEFDFPLGDLVVDSVLRLIDVLNHKNRSAGLPLSENASTPTVNQVATWQCGKPTPLSFRSGIPRYKAQFYELNSIVKRQDTDLIFYVGGLESVVQIPPTNAKKVVLSNVRPEEADVFIPVGTPGIHHDAHLFRTDNVVCLYLTPLLINKLPSSAQVIRSILKNLQTE